LFAVAWRRVFPSAAFACAWLYFRAKSLLSTRINARFQTGVFSANFMRGGFLRLAARAPRRVSRQGSLFCP
jgi:hypothetical protein